MLRRLVGTGLLALLAFAAITLYALEGHEVVVLRTSAEDGAERTIRTWIVDADGAAWVEAATPERPFLLDLARDPTLRLDRQGRPLRCRTSVEPNPEGHRRIRARLAAKYGWADQRVALVADTERSLAVRLDCVDDAAAAGRTG